MSVGSKTGFVEFSCSLVARQLSQVLCKTPMFKIRGFGMANISLVKYGVSLFVLERSLTMSMVMSRHRISRKLLTGLL